MGEWFQRARMPPVLFAVCVLVTACNALAATEGQPAPPLRAPLANGTVFNLSDAAGKVVIVNMWATWCAPCREEMPALDAYYRKYRDRGVVMLALSMDKPGDADKVREVTAGFAFPVGDARAASMQGYGRIWRLPMTFVIDRHGILRKDQWYAEDGLDMATLEHVITPLVNSP